VDSVGTANGSIMVQGTADYVRGAGFVRVKTRPVSEVVEKVSAKLPKLTTSTVAPGRTFNTPLRWQ
jgi:hypothetical protein